LHYSSPTFLALTLCGLALCFRSIFGWIGKPSRFSCQWRIWPSMLGFFLAYGAVLVKTWRLWVIFRTSRKLKAGCTIDNIELLRYLTVLVGTDALLLAL